MRRGQQQGLNTRSDGAATIRDESRFQVPYPMSKGGRNQWGPQ